MEADPNALPIERLDWEVTPEINLVLNKYTSVLETIMGHRFKDQHMPWKNAQCKNVVCEWVWSKQEEFKTHDINKSHPWWFLKGTGLWTFSNGLENHHVGGVAQWFRTNLTRGRSDLTFLDSPAYPYALILLLLHLRQREIERAGSIEMNKRRKIGIIDLRMIALKKLVGELNELSPEPESQSTQPGTQPSTQSSIQPSAIPTTPAADVLQEAIASLENAMFYQGMKVRENCDEDIWGKDVGPHQEGVEIQELASMLRIEEKGFKPSENEELLEDLRKVSSTDSL